jgi:hypothetical protein
MGGKVGAVSFMQIAVPEMNDRLLCERLNISPQQAAHINNSGPGHGLIFFGNVILPFENDFPQDNELYSIMTSKPGEVMSKD